MNNFFTKDYGLQSKIENVNGECVKRQQPEQRADNSRRPPMGLQHSERTLHPEAGFSWPLNKNVIMDIIQY